MSDETGQKARAYFEGGFYCAESVVLALAEAQGIQSDLLPRLATGFCSGLARSGGLCGAVSGAVMGINLAAGRSSPDEPVDRSYVMVRALLDEFKAAHGGLSCPALLGCDLDTAEGQTYFHENELFQRCAAFVEDAARRASRIVEIREA